MYDGRQAVTSGVLSGLMAVCPNSGSFCLWADEVLMTSLEHTSLMGDTMRM